MDPFLRMCIVGMHICNRGDSHLGIAPFSFFHVIANQRAHWCGNLNNPRPHFRVIAKPVRRLVVAIYTVDVRLPAMH